VLQLAVTQRSIDSTAGYIERVKLRIFQKMREGMQEAMEGLAGEAVAQAGAAGIQAKTGALFADILASAKVRETPELIAGSVDAQSEMTSGGRKFKGYLGTALDEGFSVKAVEGNLFQFTAPDGGTLYSRGHRAFDVKPHPFLRQAKEAFTAPIFDIIQARVAEAYEA
jgi:hypothetical protein